MSQSAPPADEMTVVGKPVAATGSQQIVTGQARYVADLSFPGMLVGRLLYTAYPSARIVALDVERARSLPGVVAVLTHRDVPGKNSFLYSSVEDQPLLAFDRVRRQGDAVVAVAAETEEAAQAALDAIEVTYEPLPGVFDPLEAMRPDAPRVWPGEDNVCDHLVIEHGDVEAGFARADVIIERTYTTQYIEHAFLEPEGAVAVPEPDGTLAVYSSSQTLFRDRRQIARALGLPESRVRVVTPFIGGAFGGKDEAHVQIHAALLAHATGRPVRIIRTREESIRGHVKRHPMIIRYRSGATRDGLLTAIQVEVIGDTGPYVTAGPEVVACAVVTASGPYAVPAARIEGYTVRTNNPLCGAMRGFGIPQTAFARERQIDELARALGLDPLELRLRNALDTGTLLPTGARIREGRGMKAALLRAAELSGWERRHTQERQPAPHLRRGWGMASVIFTVGMGRNLPDYAGASLDMAADGSVLLRTAASDMGQGIHTALAQIAAEALGVPIEAVRVIRPDTDKAADAGPAVASRQVFVSGNAVLDAAAPIRRSLLDTAAELTGLPHDVLCLRGGFLCAEGEQLSVSVADLAAKALELGRPLHADGHYAMQYGEDFPADGYPYAPEVFTFCTEVARVLVDVQTGQVKVEELAIVQDAGRVITPDGALGQIEGGAAMGYGYALTEELIVREGRTLNNSLESYLTPTAADIPPVKVEIIEIPEPLAPFGAKGIGESTLTPVAPAIANAVADAIGAPVDHLPLSAETVLAAIDAISS